jgi:hypothetical protein
MRSELLRWQWSLYGDGHRARGTLAVHLATVPLFLAGTVALVLAPWLGWPALTGALAMLAAVALQGRTHKREVTPPVPFLGPSDVVSRIFVEQWVTFPRFVLSGGFARAWRAAGAAKAAERPRAAPSA